MERGRRSATGRSGQRFSADRSLRLRYLNRLTPPLGHLREEVVAPAQRIPDLQLSHVRDQSIKLFAGHLKTDRRKALGDALFRALEPVFAGLLTSAIHDYLAISREAVRAPSRPIPG
jgi:enoyl-CoA hydratase/carnithine racemase